MEVDAWFGRIKIPRIHFIADLLVGLEQCWGLWARCFIVIPMVTLLGTAYLDVIDSIAQLFVECISSPSCKIAFETTYLLGDRGSEILEFPSPLAHRDSYRALPLHLLPWSQLLMR